MTADFDIMKSRNLRCSSSISASLSEADAESLIPGLLCPRDCMLLCGLREAIFLSYFPSMKVEALRVTTGGEKFSFY